MLIERYVRQCMPARYMEVDIVPVACDKLAQMLARSNKTWADIEMVYQLCERREVRRKRYVDAVGLYLQGKHGQMDYKYMEGLDFLIPVRSVYKEIMEFFEGSWKDEHGC